MLEKKHLNYKKLIVYKKTLKSLFVILIIFPLLFSCKTGKKKKVNLYKEITDLKDMSSSIEEMVKDKKSIFYGLYSPVKVKKIFENVGVEYTPSVLNPVDNMPNYASSSKKALNLGVYGVDMSYIQLFNLTQESVNYWNAIEKLINDLNIPNEIILTSRESVKKNINNPDSLVQIATTTLAIVRNHLGEQDRESAAAMILIGGWIEALYIATESLYNENKPDIEIASIIAEQKYSLNSLVSFAKNYHYDPEVAHYYRKLRLLQNYFNEFYIYYQKNDIEIDTVNKVIKTSGNKSDITMKNILKIKKLIGEIRDEIVD